MNKSKVWLMWLAALTSIAVVTVALRAEQATGKSEIVIRQVKPQTVLYTIYRGDYDRVGQAIGSLYAQAVKNKIWPSGALQFAYLNNPDHVSKEHWLTEIRIPVKEDALKLAGTLGEMTDVKKLPTMTMVVATKSAGQADAGPQYTNLGDWILKHGYMVDGGPCEKFLSNAKTGNYTQMKSEIMIPVKKISASD